MAVREGRVVVAKSEYVDPLNADSKISYKVIDGPTRVWGTVQLTDCQDKIEWYFSTKVDVDAKIDKAIELLSSFRDSLKQARADRKSRKPRAKRASTRP